MKRQTIGFLNGAIAAASYGTNPLFALPLYAGFSQRMDLSSLKGDYASAGIVSIHALSKKSGTAKSQKKEAKPPIRQGAGEKKQESEETAFDEIHKMVYNHLDTHPKTIDELAILCQLDVGTLFSVLTDLELSGAISSPIGGRYVGGEEEK